MGKRSPLLAAVMTVFLLSYAGIPLTAGFIGKFVIFSAAMHAGMGVLVVIAMLATVVTAFFYLRIIVMMYFSDPAPGATAVVSAGSGSGAGSGAGSGGSAAGGSGSSGGASGSGVVIVVPATITLVVIAVCVLLTVLLGIVPGPVLHVMQVTFPLLS